MDSDAVRHAAQQLGLMPGPPQSAAGGPLGAAICAAAGGESLKPAPASPRSPLDDPALASLAEQLQAWERLLQASAGREDADTLSAAGAGKRRSAQTGAVPTQDLVKTLRASRRYLLHKQLRRQAAPAHGFVAPIDTVSFCCAEHRASSYRKCNDNEGRHRKSLTCRSVFPQTVRRHASGGGAIGTARWACSRSRSLPPFCASQPPSSLRPFEKLRLRLSFDTLCEAASGRSERTDEGHASVAAYCLPLST